MRVGVWWTGLSARRWGLLAALALAVAAAGVVVGVRVSQGPPKPLAGRPGTVLLVPGYGGSTASLGQLAAKIRSAGRTATVVQLAGNGTGDLNVQARVLDGAVNRAIGAGSGPVTVIGYSAGGVVAWLWDVNDDGAAKAALIITLGSPLHGARSACTGWPPRSSRPATSGGSWPPTGGSSSPARCSGAGSPTATAPTASTWPAR